MKIQTFVLICSCLVVTFFCLRVLKKHLSSDTVISFLSYQCIIWFFLCCNTCTMYSICFDVFCIVSWFPIVIFGSIVSSTEIFNCLTVVTSITDIILFETLVTVNWYFQLAVLSLHTLTMTSGSMTY